MDKVYQSLRGAVKETFNRSKITSLVSARIKRNDAPSLNDEIEDLEKIFSDRINRLKTAITRDRALLADKVQQKEEIIQSLSATNAKLETRAKETGETFRKKEVESEKRNEKLTAKVRDLETEVKKKQETLDAKSSEVNGLNSTIEILLQQVSELQAGVLQAKEESTTHVQRAQTMLENSERRIAALENQLRETMQMVNTKDSILKELEQNLAARVKHLETELRNKDKLIIERNRQVTELSAELRRVTSKIKEVSAFFRQTEALADIEAIETGVLPGGELAHPGEEKPSVQESQEPAGVFNVEDAGREIVSRVAFNHVISELAQVTNVMPAIASVILRDQVKSLGESMDRFPRARFLELIDALSAEISDENLRSSFRERASQAVNPGRNKLPPQRPGVRVFR